MEIIFCHAANPMFNKAVTNTTAHCGSQPQSELSRAVDIDINYYDMYYYVNSGLLVVLKITWLHAKCVLCMFMQYMR